MANWAFMFTVALVAAHYAAAARVLQGDNNIAAGLTDQKNVVAFSGAGSYAGVGNGGIPFGGVGGGVGAGGDIGGVGGLGGVGGIVGTGPNGGLGAIGGAGVIPGGFGGAGAIPSGLGGLGGGVGGGTGVLPFP